MRYEIHFEIKLQMIDMSHAQKRISNVFIPRLAFNAFRSHSLDSTDRETHVFDKQSISIYWWRPSRNEKLLFQTRLVGTLFPVSLCTLLIATNRSSINCDGHTAYPTFTDGSFRFVGKQF